MPPCAEGLSEEARLVVLDLSTVCVREALALEANVLSPLYLATTACVPALNALVVRVATPEPAETTRHSAAIRRLMERGYARPNAAYFVMAAGTGDLDAVKLFLEAGYDVNAMSGGTPAIVNGTGEQNGGLNRWGDYSALTVDPVDDCTFWYTQEYLAEDAVVIGTWRTRVVSFKFPGCR